MIKDKILSFCYTGGLFAVLALAAPAAAQLSTLPPAAPAAPPGNQSAPPDNAGGMNIVGAWTADIMTPVGLLHETDLFDQNGGFVTVGKFPTGMLVRAWGGYRATPVGANQLRVDIQLQGWLPQQICAPGGNCMPFELPNIETSLITFTSPDTVQVQSLGSPQVNQATRDPNPVLLQVQVPETATVAGAVPPPPSGGGMAQCTLGETQCFSGWLRRCETTPTGGTWWITGAERCEQ